MYRYILAYPFKYEFIIIVYRKQITKMTSSKAEKSIINFSRLWLIARWGEFSPNVREEKDGPQLISQTSDYTMS